MCSRSEAQATPDRAGKDIRICQCRSIGHQPRDGLHYWDHDDFQDEDRAVKLAGQAVELIAAGRVKDGSRAIRRALRAFDL